MDEELLDWAIRAAIQKKGSSEILFEEVKASVVSGMTKPQRLIWPSFKLTPPGEVREPLSEIAVLAGMAMCYYESELSVSSWLGF